MPLKDFISSNVDGRVICIDPASHSLAWCILELENKKFVLVEYGKIDLSSSPEMSTKFSIIKKELAKITKKYAPQHGVIEQSVYIQNFQASRILSYIIGFTWGQLINSCEDVQDVNPLKWKSGIGYKNVTKSEAMMFEKKFGKKGIQKILVDERKNRVKNILNLYFKDIDFPSLDSDISDAMGIGLWYAISHGYGAVQR